MDAPTNDVDKRNVVITGFMGTGKSSVSRVIARELRFGLIDTDHVIADRHGSIPDIFAAHGEEGFRAIEREVADQLSREKGLVISTGGRLMLDPANIATLGSTGRVYCLAATADEVYSRVGTGTARKKRPLLSGDNPREVIETLMAERAPLYRRFPQVAAGTRPVKELAAELIDLIRTRRVKGTANFGGSERSVTIGVGEFLRLHERFVDRGSVALFADVDAASIFGPCFDWTVHIDSAPGTGFGTIIALGGPEIAGALTHAAPERAHVVHCPTSLAALEALVRVGVDQKAEVVVDPALFQTGLPGHGELSQLLGSAHQSLDSIPN